MAPGNSFAKSKIMKGWKPVLILIIVGLAIWFIQFEGWSPIQVQQKPKPPPVSDLDFMKKPSDERTPNIKGTETPLTNIEDVGEEIVIRVYNFVSPSVVNIVATTLEIDFFWQEVIPQRGQGSGFIIDRRGYILTNNHVVADAKLLEVTLIGGKKLRAQLIGKDPSTDIAVIKIPESEVPKVAMLGDSDKLRVGQRAIAIGNPFGLEHTVTSGIVSALNRHVRLSADSEAHRMIQTDASINPGNSGGPLINTKGEVVGITSAIFSTSGGAMGIGFAIPINTAKEIAAQLITNQRVVRPWMGIVGGFTITPELAQALDIPVKEGVMISRVFPNGPAAKAGLKGGNRSVIIGNIQALVGGDIIIDIDGEKISTAEDLIRAVRRHKVGDTIPVGIMRDNKKLTFNVTLEENPESLGGR